MTLNEIKDKYNDRHGFAWTSPTKSSERAIADFSNWLLEKKITSHSPEVILHVGNATLFVFPEGASFESGKFYQMGQHFHIMSGVIIDTLHHFLERIK
jgi:uracil-DNA glycosylase